ncbi:hypothetical protein [Pseudactinotalea sp. Z1732]|uniref:phage tail tube protein n=1 Tax=Micrococcales TaxID=85006 RepID=UPI003C799F18
MTAVRSLYEGNIRLEALSTAPADIDAITVTELGDGVRVSRAIMRNAYRLSPTGSDTIDEPGLEDTGNTGSYGASNYEVMLPLFRYFDDTGQSHPEQDVAYNVFTGKGVVLHLVERIGPPASKEWEAGDPYNYYPVVLDDPQQPTDLTGYQKVQQPARVTGQVSLRAEVTAGA